MSRFSTVSPLDFPELTASMALDGELTARGLRLAAFDPAGLSPAERETIRTRAKERAGGGPFTGAAIDIMMNPLTWFYFATSPSAAGAIGSAAGTLFQAPIKSIPNFLRENGSWLQRFGLTTGLQETSEGATGSVLSHIATYMRGRTNIEAELVGPAHEALITKLGLTKGLDPRRYNNPVQKDLAQRVSIAVESYIRQVDQTTTEYRTVFRREGKKPGRILGLSPMDSVEWGKIGTVDIGGGKKPRNAVGWMAKITHAPLIQRPTSEILSEVAGQEGIEFAEKLKLHLDDLRKSTLGVEGDGPFQLDRDKLFRIWRLYSNPALKTASKDMLAKDGLSMIQTLMGPGLNNVHMQKLKFDQWADVVTQIASIPHESGGYFPKNYSEAYLNGQKASATFMPDVLKRTVPAQGTVGRTRASALWHPEDLRVLQEMAGGTPTTKMDFLTTLGDKVISTPDKLTRFLRMNPDASIMRHTQQMNSISALAQEIGQESTYPIIQANKAAVERGLYKEAGPVGGKRDFFKTPDGKVLAMDVPIIAHQAAGNEPLGTFSVADALAADMVHMKNKYTLRRVADVYLPRVMGTSPSVGHSILRDNMLAMKETMMNFSNSALMKAVEKQGGYAEKFVQGMRNWADEPVIPGEVGQKSASLAKYLYGTHLAGNMGSVLMNMSQTLGPALSVYGVKHIAKGWALALEDIGRYTAARAEQGFRNLNELERNQLVTKTMRLASAGADGTDPVGISTKVFEVLEGHAGSSGKVLSQTKSKYDRLIDWGLMPFQKMEWFNRLATGYAHLSWAHEGGLLPHIKDLRDPNLSNLLRGNSFVTSEMTRAVQEFQFANDILNTPFVFQPGQLLGNPLTRQFASFVVRSATIPFALSPQIAGGVRYFRGTEREIPLPAGLVDYLRILGSSAIIYELGKNFLGADLTRYTGYAQVTDAYPFVREGRFSPEEAAIPVIPPIIDIPLQGLKALGTGDTELFKRQMLRVTPFGVAGGKLAKYTWPGLEGLYKQVGGDSLNDPMTDAFGQDLTGLPTEARKIMADYGNPGPDGRVPLYKPDGTLIDYRSPTQLIFQGLGFPVPDSQVPELDRFLVRNSEEMAGYKRDAIDAMLSGDMARYESVVSQYSKRFQFRGEDGVQRPLPFTISRDQINARARLRSIARSERLLDRLPPDVRQTYSGVVQGVGESRLGLEQDQLMAGATAKDRRAATSGAERSPDQKAFGNFAQFRGFGDMSSEH